MAYHRTKINVIGLLVAAGLATQAFYSSGLPLAERNPCGGNSDPSSVTIGCTTEDERATRPGSDLITDPGRTFEYLWLPSCAQALPGSVAALTADCLRAHECDDPSLLLLSLFARELTDATEVTASGGWEYQGSECRDPAEVGPVRRQLTWTDVLSAVRRVGVPPGEVTAPAYTLVNLDTTFFTEPQSIERSLTLIGYDVDVHIEPASYHWVWGDGSTDTTETPGQPYPATDVTHTYTRATRESGPLALRVDVTYAARYRVDGGEWTPIPEPITITGPTTALAIKQASAVLVAGD